MELLAGHLDTTAPYDMALAETLSGWSDRPSTLQTPHQDTEILYSLTEEALRPVLELCAQARYLSDCHAGLRRAGKGTEFTCHKDGFPAPVFNLALEDAIDLYDKRTEQDSASALPAGTAVLTNLTVASPEMPLLVVSSSGERGFVSGWLGPLRSGAKVETTGQYFPRLIGLGTISSILKGAGEKTADWWEPELPYLILMLRALALAAINDLKWVGTNLPNAGYLVLHRQVVTAMLDYYGPTVGRDLQDLFSSFELRADGAAVLEVVERIAGRTWPLAPGPIVRRAGDAVVIDIAAASSRLLRMLTIPGSVGGRLVNMRSSSFEAATQERIDQTPWRPPDNLRALRGHTLRLNGKNVTDIDALAFHDGTLLLISCKSYPYSLDYDAGEHRTVRNVRTNIEEAVDAWEQVLNALTNEPKGENYDFGGIGKMLGVVCTPHVFYVERNKDTSPVLRFENRTLRAACSIGELTRFLGFPKQVAGASSGRPGETVAMTPRLEE
jgi:hypothetical protein